MRSRAWSRVLPRASGLGTAYSGQSAAGCVRMRFLAKFRPILSTAVSTHLPARPGGVGAALAADAGVVSAGRVDAGHRNATNTPLCTPNSPRASVRRRRRLLARPRCFVVLIWWIAHHSPRPSWQDLRTANGCNSALRASLWHPWTSSRQLGAALRAERRLENPRRQVG